MSPEKLNVVNMSVRPQGFTECVKGESENRFEPDRKTSWDQAGEIQSLLESRQKSKPGRETRRTSHRRAGPQGKSEVTAG